MSVSWRKTELHKYGANEFLFNRQLLGSVWMGDSCWEWVGRKTKQGYGRIAVGSSDKTVHRFLYERWVGEIPVGLVLDHLCRNTACVRPDHLEPVTNRENIIRGVGASAINLAKTHCKRGHPFSLENTYVRPGTMGRACRICKRVYATQTASLRKASHVG